VVLAVDVVASIQVPAVVDLIQVVVIVSPILRHGRRMKLHQSQSQSEIREIKMVMIKMAIVMQSQLIIVGEVIQALEQQVMAMIQKTSIDAQHSIVQQRVVVLIAAEDFGVKDILFNK
jgi:hypothetical protein